MDLYSDAIKSWPVRKWKSAENRERASWIIWIGVPAIMSWIGLYGYLPKYNIFAILFFIFFVFSGWVILLNASFRSERDNAKLDLIKERDKASNAIEKVYEDKRKAQEKFDKYIAECMEHYTKLLNVLGEENQKKQERRMSKLNIRNRDQRTPQTKMVAVQADAIFDETTPEEVLYNEEMEWRNRQSP